MDVANKASLRVDSAHFSGDAATNVVVVRGTGFTGEHVSEGVEVTIFELDSEGKAQRRSHQERLCETLRNC